jgi:hypothetical protein
VIPRPTFIGFVAFVRGVMEIDPLNLPDGSPVLEFAFHVARDTVNGALRSLPLLYEQAVYNLAGDLLINFAHDQPQRFYFKELRKDLQIMKFTPGMIASTSDATSSTSLLNIEAMKNFTMGDLQRTKTHYGRVYLEIAQNYGPSIVGIS